MTNNAELVSKTVIFRKFRLKYVENIFFNIASFSCRKCQALSSDMRNIILLLIMKEDRNFLLALQTDGWTYTFQKSIRYTDSNTI